MTESYTSGLSVYAVIMAGGKGTRLWPESRARRPKQFLSFDGRESLVRQTADRLLHWLPVERILVTGTEECRDLLTKELSILPKDNFLFEPSPRNTAATIGRAAEELVGRDTDAIMSVLPSDQYLFPTDKMCMLLSAGVHLIEECNDRLVTLGVVPTFAHTGYGYIHRGTSVVSRSAEELFQQYGIQAQYADRFTEKPEQETANRYFRSGEYFWNSGIFLWKAQTILEQLQRNEPELRLGLKKLANINADSEHFRKGYADLKSISIDYAVMEKAKKIVVLPADFQWDDLGSFPALARIHPEKTDSDGNTIFDDNTVILNGHNNIIRNIEVQATQKKLTALVGVDDLIVVQANDILLIVKKGAESDIPKLLKKLENEGRSEFL